MCHPVHFLVIIPNTMEIKCNSILNIHPIIRALNMASNSILLIMEILHHFQDIDKIYNNTVSSDQFMILKSYYYGIINTEVR